MFLRKRLCKCFSSISFNFSTGLSLPPTILRLSESWSWNKKSFELGTYLFVKLSQYYKTNVSIVISPILGESVFKRKLNLWVALHHWLGDRVRCGAEARERKKRGKPLDSGFTPRPILLRTSRALAIAWLFIFLSTGKGQFCKHFPVITSAIVIFHLLLLKFCFKKNFIFFY